MENLESHEFKYFSLQAWEIMEFNCWSWKVMEIIVSVVGKLLQVSKQGQNKIQASYARKYPKTRISLTIFLAASL